MTIKLESLVFWRFIGFHELPSSIYFRNNIVCLLETISQQWVFYVSKIH